MNLEYKRIRSYAWTYRVFVLNWYHRKRTEVRYWEDRVLSDFRYWYTSGCGKYWILKRRNIQSCFYQKFVMQIFPRIFEHTNICHTLIQIDWHVFGLRVASFCRYPHYAVEKIYLVRLITIWKGGCKRYSSHSKVIKYYELKLKQLITLDIRVIFDLIWYFFWVIFLIQLNPILSVCTFITM